MPALGRRDQRSAGGQLTHKIYTTPRWRQLREKIFVRDMGICAMCKRTIIGKYHVDHIKAHKNDPALIWDERNLQLLHPTCHNSGKQRQERTGYLTGCDASGFPIDGAHHWQK